MQFFTKSFASPPVYCASRVSFPLASSNLVSTASFKIDLKYIKFSKLPSNFSISTSNATSCLKNWQSTAVADRLLLRLWIKNSLIAGKLISLTSSSLWLDSDLAEMSYSIFMICFYYTFCFKVCYCLLVDYDMHSSEI